jgi:hypothetical protein
MKASDVIVAEDVTPYGPMAMQVKLLAANVILAVESIVGKCNG